VVERRPDGDLKYMDSISHKYTGKPFPTMESETRGSRRVFFALSEPSPVQIQDAVTFTAHLPGA
jgi:hypothetical protein